jgi:protoporphyrin/coproporphyrin ferrochelatase
MPDSMDAVLVLSFGGPEQHEDVIPFLERVLRGRNVPRERLIEVAEHYYHFDGRSPINEQNRELVAALRLELDVHGLALPVYWGNRNWRPFLADTVRDMAAGGIRSALVFVTSAFGSYSGCRQYLEDLAAARAEVGAGAPELHKLRPFYNHPGFIRTIVDRVRNAERNIAPADRAAARLIFTAHSVPVSMARTSPYVAQLEEACRLVAERTSFPVWKLAYQSRSGPHGQPWLEPDIKEVLGGLHEEGARDVLVVPIGFISDHMEVLYDLDTDAREYCERIGLRLFRAGTPGAHPRFIGMIRELIEERVCGAERLALGSRGVPADECDPACCPPPAARPASR